MKFTKMEGCGNDYIYVDGGAYPMDPAKKPDLVRRLSDRHYGIGGDGVIFINPVPDGSADFEMEMWNADGTRSQMCGNGIRCVAKFVYDKGMTDKKSLRIVSAGSVKFLDLYTEKTGDGKETVRTVRVDMGAPILEAGRIPVDAAKTGASAETDETGRLVDAPICVRGGTYRMTCVSMGNPHAVMFVEDTEKFPLELTGPAFEHHEAFPERVNAEFVHVRNRSEVDMRVWERGTGETLACGTGACAVGVACVLNGLTEETVTVHLRGGDLEIRYDRDADRVYMTGPAVTVFEGEVKV